MKFLVSLFLLSLFLNASPSAIYENRHMHPIKSASELSYPPFSIVTKDGVADGFSVELLRAVVSVMHSDVTFYVDSWAEIKDALKEGKLDVLPLVGRTPEREVYFDFSFPYLTMHGTVLVRSDDDTIRSFDDLKDKKILVMRGDNAHEYLLRNNISSHLIETGTFEAAIKRLSQGEGDGVVIQSLVGIRLLNKLNITNVKPVDFLLKDFSQDFSFAVKDGDKELLALLNEGLAIVMSNGTYDRLHKKWFSFLNRNDDKLTKIIQNLLIVTILLSIAILVFIIWHKSLRKQVKTKTRELLENQALYQDFFENSKSSNIIYKTHDNGESFIIDKVNKTLEKLEGINREEMIGKRVDEVFKGADKSGIFKIFKEVYLTGKSYHLPSTLYIYNNKRTWRENHIFRLSNGEIVASYEDKTKEKELEDQLINNYEETLLSLVEMIEQRDTYTGGHSQRVATYSRMVAVQMGYAEDQCDMIERAGILHDIGKITTPDAILLKPGNLTKEEHQLIQYHAQSGADMLKKIPMYTHLSEIVLAHHERYDGTGYPKGLKADEIHPLARIMSLCDAFDAMTTNRIYKGRKSINEALAELESLSNIHYHADIVQAAKIALKDIKLNEQTNQFPESQIEQQRFAFFFKDQVTDAYNQNYLRVILQRNTFDREYICLNTLFMHNFTQYNERFGWKGGDEMLRKFATSLTTHYPQSLVFRLHGDDFVVMNKEHLEIDLKKLENACGMSEEKIYLSNTHFHIQNDQISSIEALEEQLTHLL